MKNYRAIIWRKFVRRGRERGEAETGKQTWIDISSAGNNTSIKAFKVAKRKRNSQQGEIRHASLIANVWKHRYTLNIMKSNCPDKPRYFLHQEYDTTYSWRGRLTLSWFWVEIIPPLGSWRTRFWTWWRVISTSVIWTICSVHPDSVRMHGWRACISIVWVICWIVRLSPITLS